ncbi:uncharacterized protein si:dkey-11f4.14 [Carassius auratus]|uniref:Uncharacterized protein si:dkey-11f4.14 n=1 Tax=Carassius auratus TaxID=7957 RepID=A0A6P6KPN1_CARAU|nr:uncharacterized protein LOC113053446 [Carassius auratus]
MRTLWEVFHLFVCVILSRFNAVTSVTFVENGNNLTLNPNINGKPEDILWTFNEHKVADYYLNEFEAYGQFKGRSWIEITTGQLTVHHMTSQDSGIYKSEIQIDGKNQKSENEVQVIDAVTSVTFVENGNNLTLNPNINGKPEDILWTFNEHKVADYYLNEFEAYGQFKGRSWIEITTGQLTVHHMTSQDSGIYKSEIQINGKNQKSENEVQVIEALQEPVVTCKLTTESKTLFCSASSNSKISFEWTGSNSTQHSKQELNISKEEKPEAVFTCTVKNEVSQKNTSFTLKDCNKDELYDPQKDMKTMLPDIFVIIGAIILGIAAVFICLIYKKINKDSLLLDTRTSGVKTNDDVQESLIDGKKYELSEIEAQSKFKTNDSEQRIKVSEDGENKEQEITDAENMSKEMELDETSKALSDNPDPDKDLHDSEDDEHEIGEAQDLTGPAQANSSK